MLSHPISWCVWLTNVARHADANSVIGRTRRVDSVVVLEVIDDGKGFDPSDLAPAGSFGIISLQESAFVWGGTARVASEVGRGTRVALLIPVCSD